MPEGFLCFLEKLKVKIKKSKYSGFLVTFVFSPLCSLWPCHCFFYHKEHKGKKHKGHKDYNSNAFDLYKIHVVKLLTQYALIIRGQPLIQHGSIHVLKIHFMFKIAVLQIV